MWETDTERERKHVAMSAELFTPCKAEITDMEGWKIFDERGERVSKDKEE